MGQQAHFRLIEHSIAIRDVRNLKYLVVNIFFTLIGWSEKFGGILFIKCDIPVTRPAKSFFLE